MKQNKSVSLLQQPSQQVNPVRPGSSVVQHRNLHSSSSEAQHLGGPISLGNKTSHYYHDKSSGYEEKHEATVPGVASESVSCMSSTMQAEEDADPFKAKKVDFDLSDSRIRVNHNYTYPPEDA